MVVKKVETGTILGDDIKTNPDKNVWTVFDGKLENPVEFNGRPEIADLERLKRDYGYSKGKLAVNPEKRIIVINPVDTSS